MNNALLYIGGFVAMVLAALFAVPYFVDWNSYRGVFEEEATRILGREVRVGGSVNLRLLPSPYVRFEKLRIADVGGDSGESIFRAESFTMWLSVPPLLRGVLEANNIELKRPVLQLKADAEGGGNWQQLSINPGLMPIVPKDVALQSVKLIDGMIGFSGPNRSELARLDKINGELAADALDGPYKFKGTLKWDGTEREVRFATAAQDQNGDIRFKTTVSAAGSGNNYVFEGRAGDLKSKPHIDGELTAKLQARLPDLTAARHDKAAAPAAESTPSTEAKDVAKPAAPKPAAVAASGATPPPEFDFRAKVTGDAGGFELADIAVMMDQGGPPQLVTGRAKMAWTQRTQLDVDLVSQWLDIDRMTAAADAPVPLEAARALFELLAQSLPADSDTSAVLRFDQLTLGGEAIGNVRVRASRAQGPLELKEFKADLPGGARLDLAGVLSAGEAVPRFDGMLALGGQSLMRFLAWGFRENGIGEGRTDGPFTIEGHLGLGETDLELTQATAEFASSPMTGELKLGLGPRPKLAMTVQGNRIDAGQVRSGIVSLGALRSLFAGTAPPAEGEEGAPPHAKPSWLDPSKADLELKLKAAELVDGARVLKNVEAEIAIDQGKLTMPGVKFATAQGLTVEMEGDATDLQANARGALRGLIIAPTAGAVDDFVRLFDLPDNERPDNDRLKRLAPLRLAGTLSVGERAQSAVDLTVDGVVQGGRAIATARLDGGRTGWRASPIDVTARFDSPDVERLIASLLSSAAAKPEAGGVARPARLVVKAAGTPAAGLLTLAALKGDGLSLDYSGRATVPVGAAAAASGEISVLARDAQSVLALAGISLGAGAQGSSVEGTLAVETKDGSVTLRTKRLAIGGANVAGGVSVARPEGKPAAIVADLDVDTASIGAVLAAIVDRAPPRGGQDLSGSPSPQSEKRQNEKKGAPPPVELPAVWPEQAFDLNGLRNAEGQVKIRFGTLALEPGLSMSSVRLEAALGHDGIKVETLEGNALGGRLASKFVIEKAPAGVGLTGDLKISVPGGTPEASGSPADAVALTVGFSGRALSPAALIASLRGKGQLALDDVTITGMSPSAVAQVADAAVQGKGPATGEPLVEALRLALKQGQLKLGRLAIPLEIADGALKLEEVRLETEDGRSTFKTVVELDTMQIDSEWQIEPKIVRTGVTPSERVTLPPVTVVYAGKLKDYAALVPNVASAALERELTVSKMEKDVGELEQLRKQDQTRARQEAERQKALEAERAKAALPPPAPVVPANGADPIANPVGASPAPTDGTAAEPDSSPGAEANATPAAPGNSNRTGLTRAEGPTRSPVQRKRRPADAWKPFQITPY